MLSKKAFFLKTAFLLTIAGLVHLIRAISGWEMQLAAWQVPVWLSWVLAIVAGCLAFHAWKFGAECEN
ncbi:MAG: hypothetical protein ABEJ24_03595 [Candidatus Magasanikbacteria bacterium]